MADFIDTDFNKDCPHHTLYFTTKPDRCPYCAAPSHALVQRTVRKVLLVLIGFGVLLWWALR